MSNISKLKALHHFIYNFTSYGKINKLQHNLPRNLSTSINTNSPKKWKDNLPKPPIQPKENLIPLHDQTDKYIGIYTKKEAEKMAKSLDLKLVSVQAEDNPKQLYYKFITGLELHKERLKEREKKKDEDIIKDDKLLTLSDKITAHDLNTRIKAIKKWLRKNHKVQVVIEGSPMTKSNVEPIIQSLRDGIIELGKLQILKNKPLRTLLLIMPLSGENGEESAKE